MRIDSKEHTYILSQDDSLDALRLACGVCKVDNMLSWERIILGGITTVYINESDKLCVTT